MRLPRVRDDPGFVFHVVGANALPASILALNGSTLGGAHYPNIYPYPYPYPYPSPYLNLTLTLTLTRRARAGARARLCGAAAAALLSDAPLGGAAALGRGRQGQGQLGTPVSGCAIELRGGERGEGG